MKIQVLCEDTAKNGSFVCEHGLSLLISTEKHTVLFDTGKSDLLLRNAETLGVDLSVVDTVVLSHGHYDHCGGLEAFLKRNSRAKVYLHTKAFGQFYHGDRYIGADQALRNNSERFCFLTEPLTVDEELTVLLARDLPPAPLSPLTEIIDGVSVQDSFTHEIYLLIKQKEKCVLFTGCAHRGITAIAENAVKHGATHLVGGFHLTDALSEGAIGQIAESLAKLPLQYRTGHCTCEKASRILQTALGKRLSRFAAGEQFVIGDHSETARFLFRCGYNCSQSVLGAFADELGLDPDTAMRLSSSFGGGMGRLREVCGAVSGMFMICGLSNGYSTPETGAVKAAHYRLVQDLAETFRTRHGSIICRELLGGTVSNAPDPSARTAEYYKMRPCERLIGSAADILEEKLFSK